MWSGVRAATDRSCTAIVTDCLSVATARRPANVNDGTIFWGVSDLGAQCLGFRGARRKSTEPLRSKFDRGSDSSIFLRAPRSAYGLMESIYYFESSLAVIGTFCLYDTFLKLVSSSKVEPYGIVEQLIRPTFSMCELLSEEVC